MTEKNKPTEGQEPENFEIPEEVYNSLKEEIENPFKEQISAKDQEIANLKEQLQQANKSRKIIISSKAPEPQKVPQPQKKLDIFI